MFKAVHMYYLDVILKVSIAGLLVSVEIPFLELSQIQNSNYVEFGVH